MRRNIHSMKTVTAAIPPAIHQNWCWVRQGCRRQAGGRSCHARPATSVGGMKMSVMIVRTFITSFRRYDTFDKCASRMLVTRSWKMRASSEMRTRLS